MNGNDTNGGASETNYAGKKIKKCKLIAQLVVPMEYDASFSIFAWQATAWDLLQPRYVTLFYA